MQTDFKFFTTIHHSITSLKVQTSKLVEQVGINKFLYLANNMKYIVSYEWLTTFTVVLYTFSIHKLHKYIHNHTRQDRVTIKH